MENSYNISEDLIENGLNLSKLNKYMNNKFVDCTASPPFLLSQAYAKSIIKSIKAFKLPSDIFNIDKNWWLRSPAYHDANVMCITSTGELNERGLFVHNDLGVRPAFNIGKSHDLYLELGDKVNVAGTPCTVVLIEKDKYIVLCDNFLFKSPFNKDTDKGNDYEASDVKQELEDYFKYSIFEVEIIKTQSLDDMLKKLKSKPVVFNPSEETPNGR